MQHMCLCSVSVLFFLIADCYTLSKCHPGCLHLKGLGWGMVGVVFFNYMNPIFDLAYDLPHFPHPTSPAAQCRRKVQLLLWVENRERMFS